jgi:hypothetical protein
MGVKNIVFPSYANGIFYSMNVVASGQDEHWLRLDVEFAHWFSDAFHSAEQGKAFSFENTAEDQKG